MLPFIIPLALIFGLFLFFRKAKKEDKNHSLDIDPTITTQPKDNGKEAIASLIIAIFGILVSLISILGLAMGGVSLMLGIGSLKSERKGVAIVGIVISIFVILIALALWISPILNSEITSLLPSYQ